MGKSLNLGTLAGVKIQIHWSFSLILLWVLVTGLLGGKGIIGSLASVAFIAVLFGCVVLHELGHALAARCFGIPTRDITLLPIGGVARLERMPRKPSQELIVALAGPAVNVVIAGLLFFFLAPFNGLSSLLSIPLEGGTFLQQLMLVNVALVVFNLLPAFPMDGGRVLRALLASVLSYSRATRIAAFIGQTCAIGLGFFSFYNPMLLLIAVFIFFGAAVEANQVAMRERLGGFQVRDGMIRNFREVPTDAPLRETVPRLLDTAQRDFPVVENGSFVGMLNIDDALNATQDGLRSVQDIVNRDVQVVRPEDSLIGVFEASPGSEKTIAVTSEGKVIGLLDFRRVLDLLNARSRLRDQPIYASSVGRAAVPDVS